MKVQLDEARMLERWRLLTLLEPLRSDGEVTRTDYIDLDTLCRMRMRAWYLDLLDHGSPELLALSDLAGTAQVERSADGTPAIILTEGVRRVLTVRMAGWLRGVAPLEGEEACRAMAHARNHYLRGGPGAPLVVRDGKLLRVITPVESAVAESIVAVVEPEDGMYEFDEKAFGLITPELMNL